MKRLSEEKTNKKKHLMFFIPSLRYGGAERVVINLTRALAASDRYRVTILLLEGGVDYHISDKIKIMRLYYGQHDIFSKARSLLYASILLKDIVMNHDVDMVLSFMQRPNFINILSRALGSKHLSCVNVRVCLTKQYEKIPGLFKLFGRLTLKWLWQYANRTFVNSYIIKDEVVKFFEADPDAVSVIYNPLSIKEIEDSAKESVEESWFKQKDIPIIINVGRLTRQKGHIYLLKATARISARRPMRLAIIGDGELRGKLIRDAQKLGISDKVLFMGWQKNPYKYIRNSNIFVLSSLWEGFPNAVLEAMACGCPVVVTNCLSGPSEILLSQDQSKDDIIDSKYGMLVNNLSISNLCKAIERILDDKGLSKRYVEAGVRRAAQFDLLSIAGEYEKDLLKVLRGS